jgi:hypothetical protein
MSQELENIQSFNILKHFRTLRTSEQGFFNWPLHPDLLEYFDRVNSGSNLIRVMLLDVKPESKFGAEESVARCATVYTNMALCF